MIVLRIAIGVVACATFLTNSLMAQGLTGQISGTVNDSSGSAVSAEVVLLNQGTGQTRRVVSDQSGNFLFAQLLAGQYTLTIAAPGFKKYEERDVVLSSSERAVVRPITLEVGAISESISVTAEAAKLQTQSAERSGTLTANMIVETPQKGRHFLSLLTLMPGVINNNNFEGPAGGGIGGIRINGSRAGALTVTSDGVPNVDTGNQQGPTLLPALESIGEIKVLLTNFQAEYGRNYGGGGTTVDRKSGGEGKRGDAGGGRTVTK